MNMPAHGGLKGENNPNSRLSKVKVEAIRLLWKFRDKKKTVNHESEKIAKLFRVSSKTVKSVVAKYTWPD